MGKFLQFTFAGLMAGAVLGWLLSLVSGNWYVMIGVGVLGTAIGIVLGVVHRKDP